MSTFTLVNTIEETALYADGVKVILAANNLGVSILVDLFNYIQNSEVQTNGLVLTYVKKNKAWVAPDWNVVLFDLTVDPAVLKEIDTILLNYGKSRVLLKPYGQIWGYLATDAGVLLELQPQELLQLEPQDKRKCVEDFYLTSKNYQVLSVDGFEAKQFLVNESFLNLVVNTSENLESFQTTDFSLTSIQISAVVFSYTTEFETFQLTNFSLDEMVLREVVLPPNTMEVEGFTSNTFSLNEMVLSLVVLPTNTMEVEAISLIDNFGVNYVQFGDP